MGIGYNPKIVTDGLVLCLDAGNTKSYPGSGTTWYDLSGRGNHHTLTGSPTWSAGKFTLVDNSGQGFTRASSIVGASSSCTVVVWYSTTDTQELWARGNQDNTYYLSASYGNDYYHENCGSPTNYVDLNTVTNPETPVDYRNGSYHMWEAKNVNFSTWTYYEWWLYPASWQMSGNVGAIMVYDRAITADESAKNFQALRGRFGV